MAEFRVCKHCGESFGPGMPRKGRLTGRECNQCRGRLSGGVASAPGPSPDVRCECRRGKCDLIGLLDTPGGASRSDFARCREMDGKGAVRMREIAVAQKAWSEAEARQAQVSADYIRRVDWARVRSEVDAVFEAGYQQLVDDLGPDWQPVLDRVMVPMAAQMEAAFATLEKD